MTAPSTVAGRVAGAPLWAHALALLLGLVLLLPVVGTGASYSADEGAAIIQAKSLADGDGWIVPHPLPEVDPSGELYPLELSLAGPKGHASYGKHPAYPVVLAAADRVGGVTAMVVVSLLATWGAAVAAAVLAARVAGGLARLALWLTGAGTPLLFNGYWVIAHSLGAVLIAWAVVCVVQAARRTSPGSWALLAAPLLVLAAGLLRTEAGLYGIGLALAAVTWGAHVRRVPLVLAGAAIALSVWAARAVDSALAGPIVGEPIMSTTAFDPRPSGGLVSERLDGLVATWLRVAPVGETSVSGVIVAVATVLLVAAAVSAVRKQPGPTVVIAGLAAALLLVRAIALPPVVVPGLLLACPILLVGAVGVLKRPTVSEPAAAVIAIATLVVGWCGVLATQYPEGGVTEWGGRYFAIGLPLAVPLVLVAVRRLLGDLEETAVRAVTVSFAVALAALSVVSIRDLRQVHEDTEEAFALIDATATRAGVRPVVVTDVAAAPRLDWARFDEHRWLLADPAEHPDLPARLAEAGIVRWVLVSGDVDAALRQLEGVTVVDEASPAIALVRWEGAP